MFFFFFDLPTFDVIKPCLKNYLRYAFDSKGYCDISELFSDNITKKEVMNEIGSLSKDVNALYRAKYPETTKDLKIISKLFSISVRFDLLDEMESFAILFWCFKLFKKNRPFEKNKDVIMEELMNFVHKDLHQDNYKNFGSIIFDADKVKDYRVENVGDFLAVLDGYSQEKNLYFRGHSKISYELTPSILRTDRLMENENLIYQELLVNCPNDFKGLNSHVDYLVKMQHYGLPTRLLDITRNPLVALYFACCSNYSDVGEIVIFAPPKEKIKYTNSDSVTILASLPLFSFEDQTQIMDDLYVGRKTALIQRFVHEIQTEKPAFENKINASDVESCFVVLPRKDNARIVKQDGAFIICGANNHPNSIINEELRLKSEGKNILVFITNKRKILKELDLLSINKSTLFPEIDCVSDYIKSKFSD